MFSQGGSKQQSHGRFSIYGLVIGLLLLSASVGWTAGKPTSVAEIALYRGPDREQILIEGAKKEGQVVFYNSLTTMDAVAQEFEKKYPFINTTLWRSEGKENRRAGRLASTRARPG